MTSNDEVSSLLFDLGSMNIRSGFAGDCAPRACFTNIVGKKTKSIDFLGNQENIFFGDETMSKKGVLDLVFPIKNGLVQDFDLLERIIEYTYKFELRVSSEEHNAFFSSKLHSPKKQTSKILQIYFETFNSPCVYTTNENLLTLLASGRTTGTTLTSGSGVTTVFSIYEGFSDTQNGSRSNIINGDLVTEKFCEYLASKDYYKVENIQDFLMIDDIKSKYYDQSLQVDLPDGNQINIPKEDYLSISNVLFYPRNYGLNCKSTQELVIESILYYESEIQKDLFGNIIIEGGNTMLSEYSDRLHQEITYKIENNYKVKVVAPLERKYSVWIGESILASLSSFQGNWLSTKEYEEFGPEILVRKLGKISVKN